MRVSTEKMFLRRSYSSFSSHPLRVCVVGSGPAGFYTAEKMLKAHQIAEVDVVDRLPTPFGLVRSGVAPDHPETKIVANQFSRVACNDRFSYIGNVTLGSSISLSELRNLYHVVVLAYGAESDRAFGIPGKDLSGIHSAREFVWWYNGHPDCSNLAPDLKGTDTAVLGQGNVALDVARLLLRPTIELATTDIANSALAALNESSIRKVYLVGRRGPVQAACTAKELREILGIKDLYIHIRNVDLLTTSADEEEMKINRIRRRVYELLSKAASSETSGPIPAGIQTAVGTGQFEELSCGLVLKSIGYKSVPVDGFPVDHHKGVVPNAMGRVLSDNAEETTQFERGLYVSGWLKRGPTATNLYCAEETVSSITEDVKKGDIISTNTLAKPGKEGLLHILNNRNVKVVPFSSWEKIDNEEKRLGSLVGKPREKLRPWNELLRVATSEEPHIYTPCIPKFRSISFYG